MSPQSPIASYQNMYVVFLHPVILQLQYRSFITSLLHACTRMVPRSILRVKILGLPWKKFFPRDESWCCVPYAYFIPYAYGTYRMRTVRTIRVWYVFLYHTRMVVPYAYTVSHSIKLCIGTGGSIPNAYYIQKAMSFIALALHY